MANQIKCPHCGQAFEPNDAFSHELEEQITKRIKHEQELGTKQLVADAAEEKERNRRLLKQLEELSDELRKLRRKDEERELEMKKKLAQSEDIIRSEVRKKVFDEHELKDLEKDKMIADLKKKAEELQAKITQGSQQNQGEVLEIALEEALRREFSVDIIEEVKKGQRGADIIQHVIDKKGRDCGMILWESKNAQWSQSWIPKLKEDQRQAKAHIAVLAVTDIPDKKQLFQFIDGVWVVLRTMVLPLALTLRYNLVSLNFEKQVNENKQEKMDILYTYINSMEFRQRIESIREVFDTLHKEIEREKQYFQTKWARQEKQLNRVLGNMDGMYGDLQGIVGQSLPDIKVPELEAEDITQ